MSYNVSEQLDAWNSHEFQPEFINYVNNSNNVTAHNYSTADSQDKILSAYNKIKKFIENNEGNFNMSDIKRLDQLKQRITSLGNPSYERYSVLKKINQIKTNITNKNISTFLTDKKGNVSYSEAYHELLKTGSTQHLPSITPPTPDESRSFFKGLMSLVLAGAIKQAEENACAYCMLIRLCPNADERLKDFFTTIINLATDETWEHYNSIAKTILEKFPPTDAEVEYQSAIIEVYKKRPITAELHKTIEEQPYCSSLTSITFSDAIEKMMKTGSAHHLPKVDPPQSQEFTNFLNDIRNFVTDATRDKLETAKNYARAYCIVARNSPDTDKILANFYEIISGFSVAYHRHSDERMKDRFNTILEVIVDEFPPSAENEEVYYKQVGYTYLNEEIATPRLQAAIKRNIDIDLI